MQDVFTVLFAVCAVGFLMLWLDMRWYRDFWHDSARYWREAYDKAHADANRACDIAERMLEDERVRRNRAARWSSDRRRPQRWIES